MKITPAHRDDAQPSVEAVLADDEAFQLASYGGTELIDQQAAEFDARVRHEAGDPPLPEPVDVDSRICFAIAYFATEEDADRYAAEVVRRGDTYNGGFLHGMPCGRDKVFDRPGRYAVTTS